MKIINKKGLKKGLGMLTAAILIGIGSIAASAQNSLPAPGSGGSFNPAPIGGGGPGMGGPGPGPGFGGPGPGWNNAPVINPGYVNQGTVSVIATGYDNMGNLRNIPMTVGYTFSYGQYDATVLSAYNPFTQSWMPGIDMPAYNTSYFFNGNTYNFYAPLSTGTYYFNL
ncbi:MAG: hypothetical protein K2H46_06135 [Muribaculaceae bacterium]|nr:hypothetical protein [Muribaculaceae bacterium]